MGKYPKRILLVANTSKAQPAGGKQRREQKRTRGKLPRDLSREWDRFNTAACPSPATAQVRGIITGRLTNIQRVRELH